MKLDSIHWSPNKLLSYNKPFNAVISAREAGKSTGLWHYLYNNYRKGYTSVVCKRLIKDISEAYVEDTENVINKFLDEPIKLQYRKGQIQDGVLDVYIKDKPFFRVVALSNPMSRIKSLMYPNLSTVIIDEFICNTRMGEKYLSDEAFRFKELYNTFQRESAKPLRVILAGNPYSLYNPYFAWLNVDTRQLFPGAFVTGDNFAVECYDLSPELREHILSHNPLYQFDDSYRKYAFDGRAINDAHIQIIDRQPLNYSLFSVCYMHQKYMLIYRNADFSDGTGIYYWVDTAMEYSSGRRPISVFNLNDLIAGTRLSDINDRLALAGFKSAFGNRHVAFKSIEAENFSEELFTYL